MQQSPFWAISSFLPNHEIPNILQKPTVHYCLHNSPILGHILSHMNRTWPPTHFFSTHFNNLLLATLRSSKWSPSCRFTIKNPVHIPSQPHMCHMPCPSHPPWFDDRNNISCGVQVLKLPIMQFSPVSYYLLLHTAEWDQKMITDSQWGEDVAAYNLETG